MSVRLCGLTSFAHALGGTWDVKKLSVYYRRGKLPQPIAYAGENGTRPLWTMEQIVRFKKKIEK